MTELAAQRTDSFAGETLATARDVLETEAGALRALSASLGPEFGEAVALLAAAAGHVVVTGMGKSGHIGRKIAATLSSTGTPAFFLHPGEASHGDLGMITPANVVLALSNSGETAELSEIIAYTRRFRVTLVAITAGAESTLARQADRALILPSVREACPLGLAPTSSTTMTLALGDALAVGLLRRKGFSRDDFHLLHPGGRLGSALRRARELMHAGEAMPLVRGGAAMADVVLEMSAKGFGCSGVVADDGTLAGIVTDGDLRRHMRPDLLSRPVEDIMTRDPITIGPETLAAEALQLMAGRITGLFVIEDRRPVGFVHLHDCLRAGVY